jgi:predicted PurR-regulated permease PerM
MTPDVASLQYPNAVREDTFSNRAQPIGEVPQRLKRLTFVVIVSTVEAALELVWTFVLTFYLVVERTNIGRDIPRCNCGSRSEERTNDGRREMHDCV